MKQENQQIQLQKLFYQSNHNIKEIKNAFLSKPSLVKLCLETLIYEEQFYVYFSQKDKIIKQVNNQQNKQRLNLLEFGYIIVQQIFLKAQSIQTVIKKCKLDIFLLIAICKGYLRNQNIKRDRIKSFFMHMFKKNNPEFLGIQKFVEFHQNIAEKVSNIPNTINKSDVQIKQTKIKYFIQFYNDNNKDFFPATLQIKNYIFKQMLSLRIDIYKNQKQIFQQLQDIYFSGQTYSNHIISTSKNIRFMIEFFRNPFNEKQYQYYPQKQFIKILSNHYRQQDMDIMSKPLQIGLIWSEFQLSSCMANIFKLGLSQQTFMLLRLLFKVSLKNRLVNEMMKMCESYLPKVFIFLKKDLKNYLMYQ